MASNITKRQRIRALEAKRDSLMVKRTKASEDLKMVKQQLKIERAKK